MSCALFCGIPDTNEVEGNSKNSAVVNAVFMKYHCFQNKGLFLRDNFVFEKSFFNYSIYYQGNWESMAR